MTKIIWQNDPEFSSKRYSPTGNMTFGQAGCLVCSAAMLANEAGYAVSPVEFAKQIGDNGAFAGNLLQHPSRVSVKYPNLKWRYDKFILGKETVVS